MKSVSLKQGQHWVIQPPNWLGDVIMAQPAIKAIVAFAHSQQHTVSLDGRGWLKDLLPYLNLGSSVAIAMQMQPSSMTNTTIVLFPNSLGSAWRAYRAGYQQRIGFSGQWRSLLLSHPCKPQHNMRTEHHRDYFLDLAAQIGAPIDNRDVTLQAPELARQTAHNLMKSNHLDPSKVICIAPGAQYGNAKRYPATLYNRIIQSLAAQGWHFIALGMQEEHDICSQCLHGINTPYWNSAGTTTLAEALALVATCRLLLCNDSGLMHVAAGLGQPVVALFGATDPQRTHPSGNHVNLIYNPADCSPCLQRECQVEGHPCMSNITPAQVINACEEALQFK
ncbi:MAG: lipopolysaccharide heptosyltransferase II [Zetaproteobacteria bacterium]|nr:lipopolysaccharide heptosyltransferase II [Zetaproteobacteria bacterium]